MIELVNKPYKPLTLHNVRDKDLGEIVRMGRKEAKKMLNVPFVHISPFTQPISIDPDSVIILVREDRRR